MRELFSVEHEGWAPPPLRLGLHARPHYNFTDGMRLGP